MGGQRRGRRKEKVFTLRNTFFQPFSVTKEFKQQKKKVWHDFVFQKWASLYLQNVHHDSGINTHRLLELLLNINQINK